MKCENPIVAIVMGSDSDLPTMHDAAEICKQFGVPYEMRVVSAHRTPFDMVNYGKSAHTRGIKVIIAGAGGAAHLPGMIAATTPLPVVGVPIKTKTLNGIDSLMSIVQMPSGVPVATVAIGNGKNAELLAMEILASADVEIREIMLKYKENMAAESRDKNNLNEEFTQY